MALKTFLKLAVLFAVFIGCASRSVPLYAPSPIQVPGKKTTAAVADAVKRGIIDRGWVIESSSPGKIVARITPRSHVARVAINFDPRQVRINYLSSENLNYEEVGEAANIHGRYNSWVRNLEDSIRNQLYR